MKFPLRDLFWLVVVAACICAVIAENRRNAAVVRQLNGELQELTKQRNTWIEFAATAQTAIKTTGGGRLTYLEGGDVDVEYEEPVRGLHFETDPPKKDPRTHDLEILPIVP
jgi:hypothetical protein